MLGIIKEINQLDIAISLPGLLTGYIHISQISDKVSRLLTKQLKSEDEDGEVSKSCVISTLHLFIIYTLQLEQL